ncbi:hypothetical protein [Acidiphilium sp. JA12-A1]|uniref:hypothetical protein n=1 Tax=Acidiphilium sp. JA12-A1 TaxID=1464546 RepID=UPI000461DFC2|nr:hypothetical protein [Acidiphilium sp. JA12-A1]KDM65904.1 hypothetical protein ACIDI_80c00010 [Acidiphilium sp. JA12-A1]
MDQLISDEDYDNLPEDDEKCFVEFENRIHSKMNIILDDDQRSSSFFQSIKSQYMASVYSVAVECGITALPSPPVFYENTDFYSFYSRFELAVQGEVARIRVRGRRSRNSDSVLLIGNTKTIIQHHISRLRHVINESDLPISRKQALNNKLDELTTEIEKPRLSFGKTMAVLSCVVVGLSTVTANVATTASEGHAAITNIMRLIGLDKQSEDEATSRLAPPQKSLPAPSSKTVSVPQTKVHQGDTTPSDPDDEIPF